MPAFDVRWVERWQKMVNQDSVARLLGRHFSADVMLEFGANAYVVSFNKGAYSTEFQSVQVLDVQNDRGTIWIVPGGFPNLKGPEAEKLYDINKLEEIHR